MGTNQNHSAKSTNRGRAKHPGKSPSQLFPCGNTRREFVWEMGGGFAGLALASLMGATGLTPQSASAARRPSDNPLSAKGSHHPTKAKACIFLMMNGGPSQVDTFDYKPELQKHAGQPLPEDKTEPAAPHVELSGSCARLFAAWHSSLHLGRPRS